METSTARGIHDACSKAARTAAIDWLAPSRAFDIAFAGDPDAVQAGLRQSVQDEFGIIGVVLRQ